MILCIKTEETYVDDLPFNSLAYYNHKNHLTDCKQHKSGISNVKIKTSLQYIG